MVQVMMEGWSDADLLAAWSAGREEPALQLLIARHRPLVLRLAERVLHDAAEAEDAAQEVWVALAGKAASVRVPVANWLWSVTTNVALARARQRRRRHEHEERLVDAEAAGPAAGNEAEMCSLVSACMSDLLPSEQELIVRVFWQGQSQSEIAREQRISQVAVHKRTRVVLERLRAGMRRRGVRVSLAALALLLGGREAAWAAEAPEGALSGRAGVLAGAAALVLSAGAALWLRGPPAGRGVDEPSPATAVEPAGEAVPVLAMEAGRQPAPAVRFRVVPEPVHAAWGSPIVEAGGQAGLAAWRLGPPEPPGRYRRIEGISVVDAGHLESRRYDPVELSWLPIASTPPLEAEVVIVDATAGVRSLFRRTAVVAGGAWLQWRVLADPEQVGARTSLQIRGLLFIPDPAGGLQLDQVQWQCDAAGRTLRSTVERSVQFVPADCGEPLPGEVGQTSGIAIYLHLSDTAVMPERAAAMHAEVTAAIAAEAGR